MAIFLYPLALASARTLATARRSDWGVLNTQGVTGLTIFSAADMETRGTLASVILAMRARVLPDTDGPATAATWSFLRSFSAASTALFTSDSSS